MMVRTSHQSFPPALVNAKHTRCKFQSPRTIIFSSENIGFADMFAPFDAFKRAL